MDLWFFWLFFKKPRNPLVTSRNPPISNRNSKHCLLSELCQLDNVLIELTCLWEITWRLTVGPLLWIQSQGGIWIHYHAREWGQGAGKWEELELLPQGLEGALWMLRARPPCKARRCAFLFPFGQITVSLNLRLICKTRIIISLLLGGNEDSMG